MLLKLQDLTKGSRIKLKNGYYATIVDSHPTNTREVIMEGIVTEYIQVSQDDVAAMFFGNSWIHV